MVATTKRTYRSALRARQAGETRRRIVEAAGSLFSEHGYAGTTLAKIAAEAGVSPETVQAHGPKAALLRAAIEVAGFGTEGLDDAPQQDEAARALLALSADEMPAAVAAYLRALHEAVAGVTRALVGGAANDPALRDYQRAMVANVREQWAGVFTHFADRGLVRGSQAFDDIVDEWCVLAGPETYLRLVDDYGWSGERYAAWLADKFRTFLA
ncbi:AcrR family transcriptional regulator [Nocardioides thalensis]|uniref:AcrR family transcriptional regulator n=1 Tax=Nocardioides thalensis TaxID=1914755 RepID=A0A853C3M3_9ACTN|nr:TetR/AcrR family transcriptional regulator [Nocardioides thalensis]NYJ01616.1 AcrR family transcriptional regulator [Nocardioides thalensis]